MYLRTLSSVSTRSPIACSSSRVGPNGVTVTLRPVSDLPFAGIGDLLSRYLAPKAEATTIARLYREMTMLTPNSSLL
jgi:hypothetical protein